MKKIFCWMLLFFCMMNYSNSQTNKLKKGTMKVRKKGLNELDSYQKRESMEFVKRLF
jgi:flagellar motor component MotA